MSDTKLIKILNVVRRDRKPTGPFFAAYCHLFPTFTAQSPLVLGAGAYIAVFRYVVRCHHRRGRAVRMARWILRYGTSCRGYVRGKKPASIPAVEAFVATNTRKCCDLSAHGERSAWLAAKKRSKEIPPVGSAGWTNFSPACCFKPWPQRGQETLAKTLGHVVPAGSVHGKWTVPCKQASILRPLLHINRNAGMDHASAICKK